MTNHIQYRQQRSAGRWNVQKPQPLGLKSRMRTSCCLPAKQYGKKRVNRLKRRTNTAGIQERNGVVTELIYFVPQFGQDLITIPRRSVEYQLVSYMHMTLLPRRRGLMSRILDIYFTNLLPWETVDDKDQTMGPRRA